jgi:membrane protease YdiL (CAAX protease family)
MITAIIRKLPAPAEFCLVVLVCFWWAIYLSFVSLASHSQNTASQAQEHYAGIGIELREKDNRVIIVQALPNSPAAKAGLGSGLVIQKIDGISTDGKSLQQCADLGRGPAGSKVVYELVDPTQHQTNTVTLTRESIQDAAAIGQVTDQSALIVVILELLGLAVTFWIARIRGWPLAAWGFRPSWKSTGAGVLLCLVTVLVVAAIVTLANFIFPGTVGHRHSVSQVSLPVLVLFATINPVFEEIIESGYFVQSLQKFGMWSAVLAGACFRAFLHAYQGIDAVVLIFPLGLIFGFVYWKWRRLWPLFIAHMLFDLTAYFPR